MIRVTTTRQGAAIIAACVVAATAVLASSASATSRYRSSSSHVPRAANAATTAPVVGVFGLPSFWRTSIRTAPVAPESAAVVADLTKQVSSHYGGNAAFNNGAYSASFYTASPSTPRIDVAFYDCQHKGWTPAILFSGPAHFRSVPVPANAQAAPGTDKELTIWSPSSDQLWEFWQFEKTATGYRACWGGRIDNVSRSRGYFLDGAGATATGLAHAGGMIGVAEAQAGKITHAIELNVIDAATFTKFAWPAQRSDGYDPSGTHLVQEGARFRLDPALDVASLRLHPLAAMIARAAQEYGFVINDKGGAVAVIAEGGQATVNAGGADPWTKLLNGTPSYAMLKGFPWSKLQQIPLGYGK